MAKFLPYAILAGIVVIFFIVCYILYAGGKSGDKKGGRQKKNNQSFAEQRELEQKRSLSVRELDRGNTAPVTKLTRDNRRERQEDPKETAFVTTKGEAVRKGGKIVYQEVPAASHPAGTEADATKILSRSEILAAMEKKDKEEAAIQKAELGELRREKRSHGESDELAGMASVVAADLAEKEAEKLPFTQPMEPLSAVHITDSGAKKRDLDKTRSMKPVHVDAAGTERRTAADAAVIQRVAAHSSDDSDKAAWRKEPLRDSPIIALCVKTFLNQYGFVTEDLTKQVQYITAAAFERIGCRSETDRTEAMRSFDAQEALRNIQKAYAAHPEDYVAPVLLRAFYDIVCRPQTETRHLVAMDALKVMPYLSRSHYQILSMLLLFLYSRNSHNVDKETFVQYIDKYVMPVINRFPTERPYFQQLDYLNCTAVEEKETHFAEILADSYPLLFRYHGFTEEELRKALHGKQIPKEFVVQSFNSPLIKLALVDDVMSARFFRLTGITDRSVQERLLRLAHKRPASFRGEEALDIMEDISPVLADLSDIWDSTMLRVSTLSLLGLYLAQGYVKQVVGEEFDLSRWFE